MPQLMTLKTSVGSYRSVTILLSSRSCQRWLSVSLWLVKIAADILIVNLKLFIKCLGFFVVSGWIIENDHKNNWKYYYDF